MFVSNVISWLSNRFNDLTVEADVQAWTLQADSTEVFYGCVHEDFVLLVGSDLYLLHFGFSD